MPRLKSSVLARRKSGNVFRRRQQKVSHRLDFDMAEQPAAILGGRIPGGRALKTNAVLRQPQARDEGTRTTIALQKRG